MKLMDRYIEERGDSHVWDNFLDYTLEVRIIFLSLHMPNHGLRGTLTHLNYRLGHCHGLDSVRFVHVHDDGLFLQLNLHFSLRSFRREHSDISRSSSGTCNDLSASSQDALLQFWSPYCSASMGARVVRT